MPFLMFKTILQSIGVSLASVGIGFVLSIILARFLGPEARGIYGSILTITILIAGLSQLGLAHGYVYHKRKSGLNGLSVLIYSLLLVVLITAICLTITHDFFLLEVLSPYFSIIIMLSFTNACHNFFQNAAQIDQRLYVYNALKITLPLLNMVGLILFYYMFDELSVFTSVSILITTTFISGLCLAWNVFSFEIRTEIKSRFSISHIMGYSSKIYGTSTIGIFINSIDKIVLLGVGTMKEFGLYSVAYGLSRMISIIPDTMSTVIYSRFAGKNESELAIFVKRAFSVLFMPLMSVCFIIAICASWLITWLFGQDYQLAAWPFIILLFEAVISSLGWMLSQRFNAAGRPGLVFLRQIVSTIPLIVIIFYSFEIDLILLVSLALLVSSLLRLSMTIILYKKVLKETAPAFYPTKAELKHVLSIISLKRAKDNNVS